MNWHNPILGRALVEVLRHQNVEIYIPTGQTPSYMAMIASGDVVRARKLIKQNVKILSEAVRQGYDIVTTEPSAALCLKEEYRYLLRDEDTELIAKNTYEVSKLFVVQCMPATNWSWISTCQYVHSLSPTLPTLASSTPASPP